MTGKLSCTPTPKHRPLGLSGVFGLGTARPFVIILGVAVLLSGSSLLAAEKDANSVPDRWRVFSLKHISAEKGKEYLAQLGIGTVSQLADSNVLLVTAQPRELIKAGAVMKLVDAPQEYVIRTISPSASAQGYPSNDEIAATIGNILIGTFSDPPLGRAKAKAIIDIHNDAVIAVAPAEQIEAIISAVEKPQTTPKQETVRPAELDKPSEQVQTGQPKIEQIADAELKEAERIAASSESAGQADADDSEADEPFGRLLRTLAEVEKRAAEQAEQVGEANEPKAVPAVEEPNEPKAVETIPEPKEPNAVATIPEPNVVTTIPEANVPSELLPPPEQPAIQPKQLDLAAVLARLEALEARLTMRLEPEPEPVTEQVTVKTEHPNEVAEPAIEEAAVRIEHPNEVNEVAEPLAKAGPYEPQPLPHGEDVLRLDLPQKLPIVQFLNFVGKHLQLDYLYDPAKVKGDVTLMLNGELRGPVKVKDLYRYLESVMQFHGFAMTRKGNLVTVQPMTDATLIDPPIVGPEGDNVEHGDVVVMRIFELKHIDTGSAENLLKAMQLGVKVNAIPEAGTLFVTGFAYRMGRIEQLLEMVDKPGEPKQFRFRQLQFTMAETLAPKIKTLVEQLGTISVTIAAPAPVPQKPAPRRPGRPSRPSAQQRPPAKKPTTTTPKPTQETVYLEADERTNRILMIGLADKLAIVDELITELDVEQQDLRALRVYEIQNVDAEEVRLKLEELGMISAARQTTATRTAPRRTTPAPKKGARPPTAPMAAGTAAAQEPLVDEPQIVVLETINSLLVNATPEQHAQVAMIIAYVDSETEADKIPYVVYPLENQDPEALAGVLNQLIQETTTKQDKAGKIVKETKQKTEEQITIIHDENTFSLIVYASKKNQKWIASLIKQLDKRRPQVLIDVTLVQITKDDAFNMDLDFLTSIPDMAYTSGATAVTSDIVDLLTAPESDRTKFLEFVSLPSVDGAFPGTAFFGNEKINALLTVMQTKKYGRVMARPKLLVNDNETGSIQTTDTTYITRTTANFVPSAGTTPVSTEQVVFEDYSAGITLTITPHISEGDMLRLEIELNRSGFTSAIDETITKPPNKADADVSTIVTVPDKSTIILGGMEKVSQSKGGKKVPILGDIPLIGGLFRQVARSQGHDKLYIFVKAHILRPSGPSGLADLKDISRKNREAFERLEREMDRYEDWPGITPEPLDPIRVLEVD